MIRTISNAQMAALGTSSLCREVAAPASVRPLFQSRYLLAFSALRLSAEKLAVLERLAPDHNGSAAFNRFLERATA